MNFVTAHDGFCLYDLVSYNQKHNLANGEGNADGHDHNVSWNCGWEGDEGAPPAVLALRRRQVKNFCALLFLSNGTPMFCAGDEFMHTQRRQQQPLQPGQRDDLAGLVAARTEPRHPPLLQADDRVPQGASRRSGAAVSGATTCSGTVAGADVDWSEGSHELAYCLRGASQGDRDIYVMVNAGPEDAVFAVQEGQPAEWRRVIDTGRPSPDDIVAEDQTRPAGRRRVRGRRAVGRRPAPDPRYPPARPGCVTPGRPAGCWPR